MRHLSLHYTFVEQVKLFTMMNPSPTNFNLMHGLITAGMKSGDSPPWRWQLIVKQNLHLLGEAAARLKDMAWELPDPPQYVCALKKSGQALGVLISSMMGIPFLWFARPSDRYLHPLHAPLNEKVIAMVDTHIVTGRTILRYGTILESLGARISKPLVLIDCDTLPIRDDAYRRFALSHFREPLAIVRLSYYLEQTQESLDPDIIKYGDMITNLGENFWRWRWR